LKEIAERSTLTELIDAVLDKTGIKKELQGERSLEADIKLENLEEFKSITRNFENEEGLISLGDFLGEITLYSDKSEYTENNKCVTLMTMHAAKGLEFDAVFVVGLEEGLFPHFNSLDDNEAMEEERRLAYVALTRAKKKLYLTNARRRMLFGNTGMNPPSRFIKEIDDEYIETNNYFKKSSAPVKKSFDIDDTIEYFYGEKVIQDKYGEGTVVGIDDSTVSIAFAFPHGVKKYLKGHKSIHKL